MICLSCPVSGLAADNAASLPRFLNFQSLLFDDNGEPVDETFIDLEFYISDQEGQDLYAERQPQVQVIHGAVNVLIGEGTAPDGTATGGLPSTVLDPSTGPKFLKFRVGDNLVSDPMELVTVPYSFYAQQALSVPENSLEGKNIKEGTLELKHFKAPIEFASITGVIGDSQIPATVATVQQLADHVNAKEAHWAKQVLVDKTSMGNLAGNDVQAVLQDLNDRIFVTAFNANEANDNLSNSVTASLTAHANATMAHGSDGTVVGINTLNTALTTHAALTQGVHGLTAVDPDNKVVGTTEIQTLINKTLESPVINAPVVTGGTLANPTITGTAAYQDAVGNTFPVDINANDDVTTGTGFGGDVSGAYDAIQLGSGVVGSAEIANGSILDEDISGVSSITKLGQSIESGEVTSLDAAKLTGAVDDARLSSNVTKLGDTIESGEVTSLDAVKLTGTIDDGRLSANITKLGGSIESGEITSLDAAKLTGAVDDARLSANVTKLGGSIESGEITDGTITTGDLNATSFASWDKDASNDLTTATDINSISGTVNDNKIASTIARDSEVSSAVSGEATSRSNADTNLQNQITSLNSTVSGFNFSGWDTNASDDFTQSQADLLYSPVSHNHDAAYASLSHNHDASYVNTGGDTMTGNLTMSNANIVMSANRTVDGVDISDLEGRVDALEGGPIDSPTITGIITYDNNSSREYASGQTVNNGTTVIYSKSLLDNRAYVFRATVAILGQNQVIVRHYVRDGLFRRNGGGALEVADNQTNAIGNGNSRVEWQSNGNNAELVAMGIDAGAGTVNYNGWVDVIRVDEP